MLIFCFACLFSQNRFDPFGRHVWVLRRVGVVLWVGGQAKADQRKGAAQLASQNGASAFKSHVLLRQVQSEPFLLQKQKQKWKRQAQKLRAKPRLQSGRWLGVGLVRSAGQFKKTGLLSWWRSISFPLVCLQARQKRAKNAAQILKNNPHHLEFFLLSIGVLFVPFGR